MYREITGPNAVLYTCCSVLCVLVQPRVDNSITGPSAVLYTSCSVLLCVLIQPRVDNSINSTGPCDGVIYSWLYKYTQHTAGCIENSTGPSITGPNAVLYSSCSVLLCVLEQPRVITPSRGPVLFSIPPAVSCCVYLNSQVITLGCSSTRNKTLQDA
jgi:hypothetical protein